MVREEERLFLMRDDGLGEAKVSSMMPIQSVPSEVVLPFTHRGQADRRSHPKANGVVSWNKSAGWCPANHVLKSEAATTPVRNPGAAAGRRQRLWSGGQEVTMKNQTIETS